MEKWIVETIKDLEKKKAYGKVTLHMEHGNVTRISVERSILPDKVDKKKTNK